jgi:hypothetical protein
MSIRYRCVISVVEAKTADKAALFAADRREKLFRSAYIGTYSQAICSYLLHCVNMLSDFSIEDVSRNQIRLDFKAIYAV